MMNTKVTIKCVETQKSEIFDLSEFTEYNGLYSELVKRFGLELFSCIIEKHSFNLDIDDLFILWNLYILIRDYSEASQHEIEDLIRYYAEDGEIKAEDIVLAEKLLEMYKTEKV